jgi:hypothetical protein
VEGEVKPSEDEDITAVDTADVACWSVDTCSSVQGCLGDLIKDIQNIIDSFADYPKVLLLFIGEYCCTMQQCEKVCDSSAENKCMRAEIGRNDRGCLEVCIVGFHTRSSLKSYDVCTYLTLIVYMPAINALIYLLL